MHLHPFTLAETETYLHRRGVTLDRYDVVQTYMLTGGVAYYLSYFQPGLSLAENIDAIYFAEQCLPPRVIKWRNKRRIKWRIK